jgi:phage recombination protein Bet
MSNAAQPETGRPAGAPVATVDAPNASQLDPALTTSSALAPIQGKLAHHQQRDDDERVPVISFDAERIRILKETIMPGATDAELDFFMIVCRRTGLDPFARQIHAVKRTVSEKVTNERGRQEWVKRDKWVYQVAIDGFRLIAERTGKYRGQEVPLYCAEDGVWREVWFSKQPPVASKVGVLRSDFDHPLYGVAMFDEYAQKVDEWENGERTGVQKLNAMWGSKPCVMISKVSEALALRKAFPQELGGLYTDDEMAQADNDKRVDRDEATAGAARRSSTTTRAGESARGGGAPPEQQHRAGAGDARTNANANWVNGERMIFPYNRGEKYKYKSLGITLDATYVVGATRTVKGKDGAPDETIDCGGQHVINDKAIAEALDWVDGKLRKHNSASEQGDTQSKDLLTNEDVEKLIGWQHELIAEIEAREERAALQSEGASTDPTSTTTTGTDTAVAPDAHSSSTAPESSTGSPASEANKPAISSTPSSTTSSTTNTGTTTNRDSVPQSIRDAAPGSPAARSLEERAGISGGDDAHAGMTADGDEHAPDHASEKAGLKSALAKKKRS